MITIMPDLVVTRRKRVHMALSESGDMVYTTLRFRELLQWLADQDHTKVIIEADENTVYSLEFKRLAQSKAIFRAKPETPKLDAEAEPQLPLAAPQPKEAT